MLHEFVRLFHGEARGGEGGRLQTLLAVDEFAEGFKVVEVLALFALEAAGHELLGGHGPAGFLREEGALRIDFLRHASHFEVAFRVIGFEAKIVSGGLRFGRESAAWRQQQLGLALEVDKRGWPQVFEGFEDLEFLLFAGGGRGRRLSGSEETADGLARGDGFALLVHAAVGGGRVGVGEGRSVVGGLFCGFLRRH